MRCLSYWDGEGAFIPSLGLGNGVSLLLGWRREFYPQSQVGNGVSPFLGVQKGATPQILQQERGLPMLRAGSVLLMGTRTPPAVLSSLCRAESKPSPCPPCPPGVKEVDYGLYPSKEMQLQWLHSYLQAYKELTQGHPGDAQVSQEELESLYVQVNKFSLVSVGLQGANLAPGLKTQPRG